MKYLYMPAQYSILKCVGCYVCKRALLGGGIEPETECVQSWREYSGSHIYLNGSLERVLTPVGYIDSLDVHHAYVRDFRGSVRADVTEWDGTVERSDYYPYGMQMQVPWSDMWAQPYKFMGKELDRENGWDSYDVQARWLTSSIAQWTTPDPLADATPWLSPYSYCGGDPVNFVDNNGMKWKNKNDEERAKMLQDEAEKVKNNLSDKRIKKQREYDKLTEDLDASNAKKYEKITKKIKKIEDDIKEIDLEIGLLTDFVSDIDNLANAEQIYTYNNTNNDENFFEMSSDGVVVINHGGSLGSLSHETAHAIQHNKGMIRFEHPGTSLLYYGVSDVAFMEILPYSIQFLLDRHSMPTSYNKGIVKNLQDIDIKWIKGISFKNGHKY